MKHLSREELAEAVAFAERLSHASGMTEVEVILTEILEDVLGERSTKKAVEALSHAVAFSKSKTYERGYAGGDFNARQHVANLLRLGNLEAP